MSEAKPKRVLIKSGDSSEFIAEINYYGEQGYTTEGNMVVSVNPDGFTDPKTYCQMMRLKLDASPETENLADIMELPIDKVKDGDMFGSPLVKKASDEGWVMLTFYKGTKDTPSVAVMGRKK